MINKKSSFIIFLVIITINMVILNLHNPLFGANNFDSQYYEHISLNGYDNAVITVFYPLYPMLIKMISLSYFKPVIVGTIFSSLVYFFVVVNWIKHVPSNQSTNIEEKAFFLAPQNYFGLFLFLIGPCNYIFLTNHTESLFLLLSFLSFLYIYKHNYYKAAICVGLSMITKNQGMFLFLLSFIILIEQTSSNTKKIQFRNLILFSFIILLIYMNWPIYLWYKFKDPISFYHQQAAWKSIRSISEYFKTFIFANHWEYLGVNSLLHECWFIIFLASAILAFVKKYYKICLYTLLLIIIIPAKGELINDYRFTIFCYPTYFFIGKYLEDRFGARIYFILIPIAVFSFIITYHYTICRWSY